MAYISLYRKWRPQTFDDVVGQDNVVTTLRNSLDSGRISHAFLFCGPRGTGKTTVARLLAKGLNCQTGPTSSPCDTCTECEAIAAGTSLNVIEIDGASNRGIEDVRELRNQVQYTPVNAAYKVYIIDEVHMLTTEAFNALLKTLEEPPSHVIFIFATTDPHRLPATILSRVQRYDFHRFSDDAVCKRLQTVVNGEGLKANDDALRLIAQHADGGMRDALGILEKCAAFAEEISVDSVALVLGIAPQEQIDFYVNSLFQGEKAEALQVVEQLYNDGRDLSQFVRSAMGELRRRMLQTEKVDEDAALNAIELLAGALREMRFSPDPRIPLEVASLKIAAGYGSSRNGNTAEMEQKIQALQQEIAGLKAKVAAGQRVVVKGDAPAKKAEPTPKLTGKTDAERTAKILEIWPQYLQELRQEKLMQCEAFLKEGNPVEVRDNALIVAFPRDRGFHKASIEQNTYREPAERMLAKLTGANLRLQCVFEDEDTAVQVQPQPQPKPSADKAEAKPQGPPAKEIDADAQKFIDVSLEIFGGKIFTKPQGE